MNPNRPIPSLPHIEAELNRGGTQFLDKIAKEIRGGLSKVESFSLQTEPLEPPDFQGDPDHTPLPVKVTYMITLVRNQPDLKIK